MLKLLIPLLIIVFICLFAGSAGLKLLGVVSVSFAAGAFIFLAFRFVTTRILKKSSPKRNKKVPAEQTLDKSEVFKYNKDKANR